MKSLLTTLVTLTTAITPVVTTTNLIISNNSHYSNNQQVITKPLLSTINDNHVIVTLALGKTFAEIDISNYNKSTTFATDKLAVGFTVNYFQDEAATKVIDDDNQTDGTIYVKITAAGNDAYCTGTTKPLSITLKDNKRTDLNIISDLSGMDPINLTYQQINKNVINSSNQLKINPLIGNFIVKFS